MTYVLNTFLAVDAHFQEEIHPRWIFVLEGGFKDDVFSGEMHSLKAQQNFSSLFACQKFMGG